ncbi:hypothetical protein [Streptomyces sp. AB3(2024)]|uniref:hypothetical protein n=1 Tax=Streptomyces sp. AB3(2024) TaxID=3317321 RepID=UPI0035A33A5B
MQFPHMAARDAAALAPSEDAAADDATTRWSVAPRQWATVVIVTRQGLGDPVERVRSGRPLVVEFRTGADWYTVYDVPGDAAFAAAERRRRERMDRVVDEVLALEPSGWEYCGCPPSATRPGRSAGPGGCAWWWAPGRGARRAPPQR